MMMTLLSEMGNIAELYRTDLICGVALSGAAVVVIIIAYFVIMDHLENKAARETLFVLGVLAILLAFSILTCKIVVLGKFELASRGSAAAVIKNAGELLLQNRF